MYRYPHVKYRYSGQIFMEIVLSQQIFEKSSNITFHENPSSWSRVVQCRQTHGRTDRQAGMTKLIVSVCNFSNEPKSTCGYVTTPHLRYWSK